MKTTNDSLNWAVLGCGVIANEMAQALSNMGKKLYAVSNRTYEKAIAFANKYGVEKVYKDYHDMVNDPDIDVIYITTPHNTHLKFAREALMHKKHVLCEKSVMLNSEELETAIELARENDVIFAEAMTIWHMPLYKKLLSLIDKGDDDIPALGKVQMITLNFGSYKEYNMKNRFFNLDLAGGALLDIGVYALSIVRSFMTENPDQVLSQVKYAPTGADEQVGIILMNQDQQMATVALSLHSKQPKRAIISCEHGYIEIMEYPRADHAKIVEAESGKVHELTVGERPRALQYELLDMESAINSGNTDIMKLQYTKDVMKLMTDLRKEWNMKYPEER